MTADQEQSNKTMYATPEPETNAWKVPTPTNTVCIEVFEKGDLQ